MDLTLHAKALLRTGKEISMAVSTVSFSKTPQAKDDLTTASEDVVVSFNVMANDNGGAAKSLYSITATDERSLLQQTTSATSRLGATIRIVNGQIQYDASASSVLQALAAGEQSQDSFLYAIQLGNGTISTATVYVTVTGANDAPVVSGAVMGTAIEDGPSSTLDALANASDRDHGAVLSVVNLPAALPAGVTYNAATHSFTLDPSNAAYQHLAQRAAITIAVNYGVSDGVKTVAASASWVVTGTNDAPRVTGAVSGAATEDGPNSTLSALGNATDVDDGAVLSVVNIPTALPDGVTYNVAARTFTLDPTHAAYQHLAAGKTATVAVSYTVSDGIGTTPASVSWTIAGTNDQPVIAFAQGANAGSVKEDTALAVTGQLTSTDVDDLATESWTLASSAVGAYGSIAVDATGKWTYTLANGTNGAAGAVQSLAAGEPHDEQFTVRVTDDKGAYAEQQVTITVTGTDDASVLSADTRNLVETNAPLATSGALTISDIDSDAHFLAQTNAGTYGTFSIAADGQWTYATTGAHDEFVGGVTYTDTFVVRSVDGTTTAVNVNILGTNDAPVLSGVTTGNVREDDAAVRIATGQLTATGANGNTVWNVEGGAHKGNASFDFAVDSLVIVKDGISLFNDTFSDNVPPPSGPFGPTTYGTGGLTYTEANGRTHLTSANSQIAVGVGTSEPAVAQTASVALPIGLQAANGLNMNSNFTVSAVYDLAFPQHIGEGYGIRLTDRFTGAGGFPGDQAGDNVVDLRVFKVDDGTFAVRLREVDFAHDSVTPLQAIMFAPPTSADQIQLNLSHSKLAQGLVTASFQYLSHGVTVGTQTFSAKGQIFQGEDWVRVDLTSIAPAVNDGGTGGTYGTFGVTQAGLWNYTLDNTRFTTQSLAQGQHATDSFTVRVTDASGSDTRVVNVDVVGTNDAPVMQNGPVTRPIPEDSPTGTLAGYGLTRFIDVDLSDTHTFTAPLVPPEPSKLGFTVPAAALNALPANLATAALPGAVGDGNGELRWDFSAPSSPFQFLSSGQSLILTYNLTVSDPSHATAVQPITIRINGSNDAVLIQGPSTAFATITEIVGSPRPDAIPAEPSGDFFFTDIDAADFHFINTGMISGPTPLGGFNAWVVSDSVGGATGQVHWTYTANPSGQEFLAQDEVQHDVFEVMITDGRGGFATATVSIDVVGTNDGPRMDTPLITAELRGHVGAPGDTSLSFGNNIGFSDVDLHDAHTVFVTPSNGPGTTLGSLTASVFADSTNNQSNSGLIHWAYDIDPIRANGVLVGTVVTDNFDITVQDAAGAGAATHVAVTIYGSNHAPDAPAFALSANENSGVFAASLLGLTSDYDGDMLHVENVHRAAGSGMPVGYTLSADGSTINVDTNDPAYEQLALNELYSAEFGFDVVDSYGARTSSTAALAMVGQNDAPVAVAEDVSGAVTELISPAGSLTDTGIITFSDVDRIDVHLASPMGAPLTPAFGMLSVALDHDTTNTGIGGQLTWTYAVTASALEYLAESQTREESFLVSLADQKGGAFSRQVTITATGTNDAVTITGDFAPVPAPANPLQNGSFEAGLFLPPPGGAQSPAGGSPVLNPWLITGAGIDVVATGYQGSSAPDGRIYVDLSGSTQLGGFYAGGVQQAFATTAGTQYTVSFDMSGNPDGPAVGGSLQRIRASAAGQSQDFSFETSGHDWAHLGWAGHTFTFTANAPSTTLSFASLDGPFDFIGPLLDNVVVATTVPPPSVAVVSGHEAIVTTAVTTATGGIAFSDADVVDVHLASVAPHASNTTSLGTLSLGPVIESATTADGSVTWNYALGSGAAEYLATHDGATETYTVSITDQHGSVATQDVVITIDGGPLNAAPEIHLAGSPQPMTIYALSVYADDFEFGVGQISNSNYLSLLPPNAEHASTHAVVESGSPSQHGISAAASMLGADAQEFYDISSGTTSGGSFALTFDVHGDAGGTLSFAWQFNAGDDANDYGFYAVDGQVYKLADVASVGGYSHDTPWQTYSIPMATGSHTVGFGVMNVGSFDRSSFLRIDDVLVSEPLRAITGISVSDADAGSDPIEVSMAVSHGAIALVSGAELTGTTYGSDGTIVFTGSQTAINAALALGAFYVPESGTQADTLAVHVSDLGHNGAGGPRTADSLLQLDVVNNTVI